MKALFLLPVVRLFLHIKGLQWCISTCRRYSLNTDHHDQACLDDDTDQMARVVNGAARLLFRRPACLERSLLLWWLLLRRGVASELRIGVCRDDSSLNAHAWLERDGRPLNDRLDIDCSFLPFTNSFTSSK